MVTPTREPGEQAVGALEPECPRCGSAAAPAQEYCLECGARLPPPGEGATGPRGRLREGTRESLLTVLVAFVVAVVAAAAVVAVQVTRDDAEQPLLVATPPEDEVLEEPEPVETALPTEEEPVEEEPVAEEPAPAPPPQQQQLISWPAGTDGFTVILASLPSAAGRAPATLRAREARDAGLPEVGVLLSSNFASLHPGYFVVFSGVYATRPEAESALPGARAAGHQDAYVGAISP